MVGQGRSRVVGQGRSKWLVRGGAGGWSGEE